MVSHIPSVALLEEWDHFRSLTIGGDAVDQRAIRKRRSGLNKHICMDLDKNRVHAIGPDRFVLLLVWTRWLPE